MHKNNGINFNVWLSFYLKPRRLNCLHIEHSRLSNTVQSDVQINYFLIIFFNSSYPPLEMTNLRKYTVKQGKCSPQLDSDNCLADCSTFRCNSGHCTKYSTEDRCDGRRDCADGSDESGCDGTGSGGYMKFLKVCAISVSLLWIENEENVKSFLGVYLPGESCDVDDFLCMNGHCIAENLRCNNRDDCLDFSDENNCRMWIIFYRIMWLREPCDQLVNQFSHLFPCCFSRSFAPPLLSINSLYKLFQHARKRSIDAAMGLASH